MAKKRKLNPNRFQNQDGRGLFAFDPVRRNVLKWGIIAGAGGGMLMLQPKLLWQIAGVLTVVFISNHRINQAARRIPRWHATILSFAGVMIAMTGVIIAGTVLVAYFDIVGG